MKKATSLILVTMLYTASCTAASPRAGQSPNGLCTRDINPWGHASQCSCDEGSIYDERAGLCLHGSPGQRVMLRGRVTAGVMAIGGETTGFVITTPQNDSYELILKVADQEKMTRLDGLSFEVEGELLIIESVERKQRKAIIAERIAILE